MRLVDIDDIRVMKFLSEEDDPSESDGEREYRNGWNDALTAINDIQPSAEPVRKLDEWCTDCKEYDHDKHCCPRFNRVIKSALKDSEPEPSDVARTIATIIENEKDMRVIAQPVRKGKWIEEKEDWRNQIMWVSCSECGFASGTSYNFCPNCGASMSEGEEDEP